MNKQTSLDGLCYKNGVSDSSILIRNFFFCLKMFIMQQRKSRWDEIKRMGRENWLVAIQLRLSYNTC